MVPSVNRGLVQSQQRDSQFAFEYMCEYKYKTSHVRSTKGCNNHLTGQFNWIGIACEVSPTSRTRLLLIVDKVPTEFHPLPVRGSAASPIVQRFRVAVNGPNVELQ